MWRNDRNDNLAILDAIVQARRRYFLSLFFQNFSYHAINESAREIEAAYRSWQQAQRLLDYYRETLENEQPRLEPFKMMAAE